MRISFDLDDTLVLHAPDSNREIGQWPRLIRRLRNEPLRLGTCALFGQLRQRACNIWIYTTSGRTPFYIRSWLYLYGIRVDGIVNEERHLREMAGRRFARVPSKFPPAFGIDLHVDDSEGVLMEGREYGFQVVVVGQADQLWTQKVLEAVDRVYSKVP